MTRKPVLDGILISVADGVFQPTKLGINTATDMTFRIPPVMNIDAPPLRVWIWVMLSETFAPHELECLIFGPRNQRLWSATATTRLFQPRPGKDTEPGLAGERFEADVAFWEPGVYQVHVLLDGEPIGLREITVVREDHRA